ncbi:MAG: miaB, partial [Dehalococcoidia bacterium]|nr:miaB [Dehalococcoidia bacterium]
LRGYMGGYYIWTIGCQMNVADSERLGGQLEGLGYQPVSAPEAADIVVLNSCVVRQHAEDRVVNKLASLRALKKARPDTIIGLMGCMVGAKPQEFQRRFPHVDVFMRPQQFDAILTLVEERAPLSSCQEPGPAVPPVSGPTAFVPIIHGCDHFCTFCIVPYRRGRERSRPVDELEAEVSALVNRGIREVTLLGQKVDSYGHDLAEQPDLADLLHRLNDIPGLERIRFLTSFPMGITDKIISAVADLEKVCEHFNIPFQSGDDDVLRAMRRGYTVDDYRRVVDRIRSGIPEVSLSTDVIVGFPGETDEQFEGTCRLLQDTEFDVVHVAAYSDRPGTIASRTQPDDVAGETKKARLKRVEEIQEAIADKLNADLVGREVEVLVESRKKGKWEGRTRANKLVFFDEGVSDLRGELAWVHIDSASPWSLQGSLIAVV